MFTASALYGTARVGTYFDGLFVGAGDSCVRLSFGSPSAPEAKKLPDRGIIHRSLSERVRLPNAQHSGARAVAERGFSVVSISPLGQCYDDEHGEDG